MTLTRDEKIQILEEIIRDATNSAARIAAIKQHEAMTSGEPSNGAFAELDGPFPRIRRKTA